MPLYRKVLKNYIPSCSKIILLFVQTHGSVFLYPFSNPFLCQCHTATILWQMRGFRLVILILIFAFCLECTECLVTEIVQHRGEAVLRKHLRTFEENQMSNIIRRTKGKRTLKFLQFNNIQHQKIPERIRISLENHSSPTENSKKPIFLKNL